MWQFVFDVALLWAVQGSLLVIHQTFYWDGKTEDGTGCILQYYSRERWRQLPQSCLAVLFFTSITGLLLSFIRFVKIATYMTDQLLNNVCCLYDQVIWVVYLLIYVLHCYWELERFWVVTLSKSTEGMTIYLIFTSSSLSFIFPKTWIFKVDMRHVCLQTTLISHALYILLQQ